MPKYNGHKNWNHWNVHLWLTGDETLYKRAQHEVEKRSTLDEAAKSIYNCIWYFSYPGAVVKNFLKSNGEIDDRPNTPDGAPFTITSIRAAIAGWNQ